MGYAGNSIKVFLKTDLSFVFIGTITNDSFRLYDQTNYYKGSFGIDNEILESKELDFRNIDKRFRGKTFSTTRDFFKTFAQPVVPIGERNIRFLKKKLFGQNTADLFELYVKYKQLGEKEIFDLFPHGWTNGKDFQEWLFAIEVVERWKKHQIKFTEEY